MPEKQYAYERYGQTLLQKLFAEGVDRFVDQRAAIVRWHDANTRRQRGPYLLYLLFDSFDYLQGIFSAPHDNDSADGFALPIQFADTGANFGSEVYFGDIF